MMIQNNIKSFEVAAFRYYGHYLKGDIKNNIDEAVIRAAKQTLLHLEAQDEQECAELVKRVYCRLPLGNIDKGVITHRVDHAAFQMHMDSRTVWRKLHRARDVFKRYYQSK